MRKIFILFIAAGAAYAFVRYVPSEMKHRALGAVGADAFFRQTLPNYLREKFSLPENPVVRRQQLLNELTGRIKDIERELEVVAPPATDGESPPPVAKSAEVRPRIEKSRELLAESERLLGELEAANPGESTFRKAADRLLAKIFPPPASGVADGVGGDAAGGTECACPPR